MTQVTQLLPDADNAFVSRYRVLIIAENCNPEWTSVPLVGWSHYQALTRVVDAHLVTQIRNRDALIRAGLVEGKDFTAIDSEKIAGPAHKVGERLRGGTGKGWTTKMVFNMIGNVYFQRLLRQQFEPRLKAREFDIVQHITMLSPTVPVKFASCCHKHGVPFIWGPINGGLPWPKGFRDAIRQEREWLSKLRSAYKLLPGYRSSRRDSSAILVGSIDTFNQMGAKYHHKCFYLPENAIDPARFAPVVDRPTPTLPLRVCFLGRLVPYKGADMLIDACEPMLRDARLILDIIGEGPQRAALDAMIRARSIPNVHLLGNIAHDQLSATLASYHVLGFPSIREFGGAVALEAMALGVVPVVPNYGGLGELVSPASGFLIEMGTRVQIVERFRSTLEAVCRDPSVLIEKSRNAVTRVNRSFTWDAKARADLAVYDWILRGAPRPTWPMPIGDLP